MKKKIMSLSLFSFAVIMVLTTGVALAKSSAIKLINSGEIFPRDKFVAAQNFRNDGTIKGDLFFWAQSASSAGLIEGDVIGAGQEVDLTGTVQGDTRVVGRSVTVSGNVARNLMAAGSTVMVTEGTKINGSFIAAGQSIISSGVVKKNSMLFGKEITLKGEYFGDVTVNYVECLKDKDEDTDFSSTLVVLPGTVIHGVLTYQGSSANIQKGAQVADFKWIKTKTEIDTGISHKSKKYIWKFVRTVFTTVVLFLLGLLLFRTFPVVFNSMSSYSEQNPWNAVLAGLVALFSTIPAVVVFIVLMALSFIISPAFGLIFGFTATGIYIVLFYLSIIPASLWIGNKIMKNNPNVLFRFGIGLVLFNITIYVLKLLAGLKVAGPLFPALAFIVKFGALLLGAGILIHAAREIYVAARR